MEIQSRLKSPKHDFHLFLRSVVICVSLVLLLTSCVRPAPTVEPWWSPATGSGDLVTPLLTSTPQALPSHTVPPAAVHAVENTPTSIPTQPPVAAPTQAPEQDLPSPTPDDPRPMPTLRTEVETYVVQPGDSLGKIAQRYQVSLRQLIAANDTVNPDLLYVGTVLTIPVPNPDATGPDFKIIPDSELVYGPASADFDIEQYVQSRGGYLATYSEKVDDIPTSGAKVIARIAYEYSVNPRLLLAVLEYQSNWVTASYPNEETRDYPMGVQDASRKGLYRQLAWTADTLSAGYYGWKAGAISVWMLADGTVAPVSATINPGTAAVQNLFAALYDEAEWRQAVTQDGLYAAYTRLFGSPFNFTFEPITPADLQQPPLQLPFEEGDSWSFTGGPHGGWTAGTGWAALDFAPPGEALGCFGSYAWEVAMADGLIIRSSQGAVVQDLDGDGKEQTGWTILYMHIESHDRVSAGTYLHAGERIGHASCEGGYSTGTHTHVARRYNGEWIPADGPIPFNMDGWVSIGTGIEYDGYLTRNEQTIYAWNGRTEANQIWR